MVRAGEPFRPVPVIEPGARHLVDPIRALCAIPIADRAHRSVRDSF